ncbi:hypothetical protein CAOG_07229 [Capsaspora owczarzaki ATCC 30864]|uniref:DUF4211 domain-containing protein n=1 Tax=Capsaspora owczarzaki (strain ATCC 30864) TaxID=595528 RepID=A0A0D2WX77_CAPO3|nr:hypothetical protein CAOG_07229 [Capsaspora owczarzaki ATCC 30864]KJE97353.1 hypothetical protein CAOG_007229 [Capsaspora owczarzaki ATCC 30864]|eukprot:XP_004343088.1 hypothetical protein CAOG_07229 [Capsaspora owczarzaki ATCC 30864]
MPLLEKLSASGAAAAAAGGGGGGGGRLPESESAARAQADEAARLVLAAPSPSPPQRMQHHTQREHSKSRVRAAGVESDAPLAGNASVVSDASSSASIVPASQTVLEQQQQSSSRSPRSTKRADTNVIAASRAEHQSSDARVASAQDETSETNETSDKAVESDANAASSRAEMPSSSSSSSPTSDGLNAASSERPLSAAGRAALERANPLLPREKAAGSTHPLPTTKYMLLQPLASAASSVVVGEDQARLGSALATPAKPSGNSRAAGTSTDDPFHVSSLRDNADALAFMPASGTDRAAARKSPKSTPISRIALPRTAFPDGQFDLAPSGFGSSSYAATAPIPSQWAGPSRYAAVSSDLPTPPSQWQSRHQQHNQQVLALSLSARSNLPAKSHASVYRDSDSDLEVDVAESSIGSHVHNDDDNDDDDDDDADQPRGYIAGATYLSDTPTPRADVKLALTRLTQRRAQAVREASTGRLRSPSPPLDRRYPGVTQRATISVPTGSSPQIVHDTPVGTRRNRAAVSIMGDASDLFISSNASRNADATDIRRNDNDGDDDDDDEDLPSQATAQAAAIAQSQARTSSTPSRTSVTPASNARPSPRKIKQVCSDSDSEEDDKQEQVRQQQQQQQPRPATQSTTKHSPSAASRSTPAGGAFVDRLSDSDGAEDEIASTISLPRRATSTSSQASRRAGIKRNAAPLSTSQKLVKAAMRGSGRRSPERSLLEEEDLEGFVVPDSAPLEALTSSSDDASGSSDGSDADESDRRSKSSRKQASRRRSSSQRHERSSQRFKNSEFHPSYVNHPVVSRSKRRREDIRSDKPSRSKSGDSGSSSSDDDVRPISSLVVVEQPSKRARQESDESSTTVSAKIVAASAVTGHVLAIGSARSAQEVAASVLTAIGSATEANTADAPPALVPNTFMCLRDPTSAQGVDVSELLFRVSHSASVVEAYRNIGRFNYEATNCFFNVASEHLLGPILVAHVPPRPLCDIVYLYPSLAAQLPTLLMNVAETRAMDVETRPSIQQQPETEQEPEQEPEQSPDIAVVAAASLTRRRQPVLRNTPKPPTATDAPSSTSKQEPVLPQPQQVERETRKAAASPKKADATRSPAKNVTKEVTADTSAASTTDTSAATASSAPTRRRTRRALSTAAQDSQTSETNTASPMDVATTETTTAVRVKLEPQAVAPQTLDRELELLRSRRQELGVAFPVFLQFLLSVSVDSDFLGYLVDSGDHYFLSAVRRIDAALEDCKSILVASDSWNSEFKSALDTYPHRSEVDSRANDKCEACGRGAHTVAVTIHLQGPRYDSKMLQELPCVEEKKEAEEEEQSSLHNSAAVHPDSPLARTSARSAFEFVGSDDEAEHERPHTASRRSTKHTRDNHSQASDQGDERARRSPGGHVAVSRRGKSSSGSSDKARFRATASKQQLQMALAPSVESVCFKVGKSCAARAAVYHDLSHFKWQCFMTCRKQARLAQAKGQLDQRDTVAHCLDDSNWVYEMYHSFRALLKRGQEFHMKHA